MKANELRIGNYVYLKSKDKIYEISSGHDIEEISDAPENFDAKPIPLTEEWLLKFGFKKELDKSLSKGDIAIFLDKRFKTNLFLQENQESFKWYSYELKVEYVHQLQNLYFTLACKELTILS
jgi:hypothetical protein